MRMPYRPLGLSILLILASQGAGALPFCKSKQAATAPPPFLFYPGSLQQVAYYPVPVRPQARTQAYPPLWSPAYPAAPQSFYRKPALPPLR